MAVGFTLTTGIQSGTITLNSREIDFDIEYNDDFDKYYISLYENGEVVLGGRFLTNGTDLLHNYGYLDLGQSLVYTGQNDLSEGYLVYEE